MNEAQQKIIKYPNDLLRKKTRKIKNFKDPNLSRLVSDMTEIMDEAKGVGLAAPQIGSELRVCLVRTDDTLHVLINPEIKTYSRKKEIAEEGCLSFPGKYFPVERAARVKVRANDLSGGKIKLRADGLLARALQHEIDHLEGILMIDRVKKRK